MREIYFEVHWVPPVELMWFVGVVWSVSVGSIEPFHKGVDDVFWIEHNFEDANLRKLNSRSM